MLYVTAVVLLMVFLGGFLVFVCYSAIDQIRSSIATQMSDYSALDSYPNYELANTFMVNLWKFMPVILLLGVGYWVYIYSQHKRAELVYE